MLSSQELYALRMPKKRHRYMVKKEEDTQISKEFSLSITQLERNDKNQNVNTLIKGSAEEFQIDNFPSKAIDRKSTKRQRGSRSMD